MHISKIWITFPLLVKNSFILALRSVSGYVVPSPRLSGERIC